MFETQHLLRVGFHCDRSYIYRHSSIIIFTNPVTFKIYLDVCNFEEEHLIKVPTELMLKTPKSGDLQSMSYRCLDGVVRDNSSNCQEFPNKFIFERNPVASTALSI